MPDYALRDAELRSQGLFAAEGRLLVTRAFAAGLEIVRVFADAAAADEARALYPGAAVLDADSLSSEAGYPFHRGMLAHVRRPRIVDAALPLPQGSGDIIRGDVLVLPKITDPGNMGAILRSALAFGFTAAFLGKECMDPFNRKALRASMGAAYRMAFYRGNPECLRSWLAPGTETLAAALEPGAIGVDSLCALSRVALILGNEHDGIDDRWRQACDRSVMIPVSSDVDSLNVAVAGSIIMREISRRGLLSRS